MPHRFDLDVDTGHPANDPGPRACGIDNHGSRYIPSWRANAAHLSLLDIDSGDRGMPCCRHANASSRLHQRDEQRTRFFEVEIVLNEIRADKIARVDIGATSAGLITIEALDLRPPPDCIFDLRFDHRGMRGCPRDKKTSRLPIRDGN